VVRDPRLNHSVEVIGGVREAQCSALLSTFFEERR
jgi:tRNA(adenine34) deaminase